MRWIAALLALLALLLLAVLTDHVLNVLQLRSVVDADEAMPFRIGSLKAAAKYPAVAGCFLLTSLAGFRAANILKRLA